MASIMATAQKKAKKVKKIDNTPAPAVTVAEEVEDESQHKDMIPLQSNGSEDEIDKEETEESKESTADSSIENLEFSAKIGRARTEVKRRLRLVQKKARKERDDCLTPGVVYVGRIPHGFYEEQMKSFFSQFGDVTRLKLARNKKSGRSRNYAFVEFASDDVAKIVAETMDNYLMFGRLLKCKFLPHEEVHPNTFAGANKPFRVVPFRTIARKEHNKERTPDQHQKLVKRLKSKEQRKRTLLKELGVSYDFPGY